MAILFPISRNNPFRIQVPLRITHILSAYMRCLGSCIQNSVHLKTFDREQSTEHCVVDYFNYINDDIAQHTFAKCEPFYDWASRFVQLAERLGFASESHAIRKST